MAVYLAVPLNPTSTALNSAVEQKFEITDRYQLQSDRGWLIKFPGTSIELSNYIGLTGRESGALSSLGSAIIVPVLTYYGRGPSDMWEWIKTRLEQ